jgi:hypothetical protein
MIKQVEVHGHRVKLYSLDGGQTWSSSPQSIVAYRHRERLLRRDLQKTFERLGEIPDFDPNTDFELEIHKSPRRT